MKEYLLAGLLVMSNYALAEDEDIVQEVISIIFGDNEKVLSFPTDELNENIDLLIEDLNNGKEYTSSKTGSSLKQVTDLFIDCEKDTYGKIISVNLIRVVKTKESYVVKTIAQLDDSFCK